MLRRASVLLCSPGSAHAGAGASASPITWGAPLKNLTRRVYGSFRRVKLNFEAGVEAETASREIDPTLLDKAEEEVKRLYWGEYGDEGAMNHGERPLRDLSPPETMHRMASVLTFCVREDPELQKKEGETPSAYARHKSAVCQSMYLMTVQQAQVLLPQQLLELLTIEVLTRLQSQGCSPPTILPSDTDSVRDVFQYWSDAANRDAGVDTEDKASSA